MGASNNVILKTESPSKVFMYGVSTQKWQAIKSLRLKGHVRARGSTLWRHRSQEASEFLCTKTPLVGESWAKKNIAQNPRKCTLRRAINVMFSKFRGWRRKKKNTALRAVWINSLIRINVGPNILRNWPLWTPFRCQCGMRIRYFTGALPALEVY